MSVRSCKIVVSASFALIVMGAIVTSAFGACRTTLAPCAPPAFAGSYGVEAAKCRKRQKVCRARGPAGPKGATGKNGADGVAGLQGIPGIVGLTGAEGSTGLQGSRGLTGSDGATGTTGLAGTTGTSGATGATGLIGLVGPEGPVGSDGAEGPAGPEGPAGSTGIQGAEGATGSVGPTGDEGAVGATGDAGPTGASGSNGVNGTNGTSGISTYAYVYNLEAQVVAITAPITFDSNGPIGPGITHAPGTSQVNFSTAGIYKVAFSASGTEPNQMALFVNGVLVPGSDYASGAGTQQNSGQAILAIGAGDSMTLNNYVSSAAVTLATPIGGTASNVNASLLIEKLD